MSLPPSTRPDRRPQPSGRTTTGFLSSFEEDETPPAVSRPFGDETRNVTGGGSVPTAMRTEPAGGPTTSATAKPGVGFTGTRSLEYGGRHRADGEAVATNELFDGDVEIAAGDELAYLLFPVLDEAQTYASTHVAVDLLLDDGTRLSGTGATDAYGFPADARGQGTSAVLWPDQWNSVRVDLSALAGRRVVKVLLGYSCPDAPAGTRFQGWLDDVRIGPAEQLDASAGPLAYVDTRRGTNASGDYSRGNNLPAAAWPNGFAFFTPMTDAGTIRTLYAYQAHNNERNLPELQGIGISHQPSIWMGDRNQLAVLPAATHDPDSGLAQRALEFDHADEVARPDLYQVISTDGLTAAITPTDHGGVYRFDFPAGHGSVLVDQVVGESSLSISDDGVVAGWVEGGSRWPGRTRMFVHGAFDTRPRTSGAARGERADTARFAAFDTDRVELRVATSFISLEQARRNHDLELAGRTFEEVRADVAAAWEERLSVVAEVEGATDEQLVTLYSGLYRLNLYPNSSFENTGTAEEPRYRYASPVDPLEGPAHGGAGDTETNAAVKDGKLYVNNGFWDTYRTAWPLYALLYPELTAELVDGFVQQYRDGGWVARWSSPGYADLMTGTSSDVAFAEAYLAGALPTDLALDAYDAAVRNATVLPANEAVGRKGLERSIFLGFTPEDVHQSASWGLEGYINDFGIAEMAAALAEDPATPADRVPRLREEAAYFRARAGQFTELFNPAAGVFTARNADGSWPVGAEFDKADWGGAFTEASGWTFAFHAPHDVAGMAALHGGRRGLLAELDAFLTTPERAAYSTIHEAREARDVRIGMLGMSNQVAHHIPYVLAEAGDPARAQALVRDIQQRLFVGSDIGQGYPGDEDNGEMSAWYVFSALGFYPLRVGSGDYTVGSPTFDRITVRPLGSGRSLTVEAPGASDGRVHVAGLELDGVALTDVTVDGDLLRRGGTLRFTMSDGPSDWGAVDLDEPLTPPHGLTDVTGTGRLSGGGGDLSALTDDDMRTAVDLGTGSAELVFTPGDAPVRLSGYTLTSSGTDRAPTWWVLEGSTDGETWVELDARRGETFPSGTRTRPFAIGGEPRAWSSVRLRLGGAPDQPLRLAELELFAAPGS
ncbi:GH92 family glycosyl hydrolase [Desertihabitans aurantiacus]|uniref:GH92 family glycosyl hydrolase n=1 Tax=Desertihabitans aurantiacus TaxID=2282477 RepID=UPI001E5E3C08|nr:GH92 family glycosyl hydrolase [Desertihabitans aurantiacus]